MRSQVVVGVLALAACQIACGSPAQDTGQSSAQAAATTETLAQVTGRAPAGALVVLEPAAGPLPLPQGNAVLDQYAKAFVPETLVVRVGQPVTFKNSEDQLHNVTVIRSRAGTGVFNISQSQGDVYEHTFDQPGEYEVTCDVHPGMRATIVAAHSPWAAYADVRGGFAFQNVVPGEYRLRVTAGGRESERAVTIAAGKVDLGDTRSGS